MIRNNLTSGEVPFNPFLTNGQTNDPRVLHCGYMVVHGTEVPDNATGFMELSVGEPADSQRREALIQAATHITWMAQNTGLSEEVVIRHRQLEADASIRLVLPDRHATSG